MRLRIRDRVVLLSALPGVVFGTISVLTLRAWRDTHARERCAVERNGSGRAPLSGVTEFIPLLHVVALSGILGTIVGALQLARGLDKQLRRVRENAQFPADVRDHDVNSGDVDFDALDAAVQAMTVAAAERQAALQTALDRVNEVSRLKSQFVATLSHEIRTPMNGVIGMSELLLQTPLNSEQHDYADAIAWSGTALLTIVNDLLDFSKIEAGHMQLDPTDFNLVEAVESVTTLLASQAQVKGIVLMSYIDSAVPRIVHGDSIRLRQVLLNLIGNALKFTEHGSVIVDVAMLPAGGIDSVEVRFSIVDTGIGIAPAVGDSLFEPFAQADGSTTRRFGGTGLGLAISRSLVEMMGGHIHYTSEVGAGTTFTFSAIFTGGGVTAEPPLALNEKLRGSRALVVDDDAATREIFGRYLRAWGMRADTVADPHQVQGLLLDAAAAGEPYAVAIIDYRMPELDGLQLGRELSAQSCYASTALILVTAYDDVERGKSAHEAGFSDYLVKPIRHLQLYSSVVKAIGARSDAKLATLPPAHIDAVFYRSERVLLVEDNAVNQRLALRQLAKLGFAAVCVDNGLAAVRMLETTRFDLVLMDCHMPVMDGFEAAAHIRRREQETGEHVVIVAMTASAQARDREECLAAGMDDYLSKPVSLAELERIIERRLRTPGAGLVAAVALPI